MTERDATTGGVGGRNVRIVTLEQAIAEARAELDEYERRYGVPSEQLRTAFTDATGRVHETGGYLRWFDTWQRWRALQVRARSVA